VQGRVTGVRDEGDGARGCSTSSPLMTSRPLVIFSQMEAAGFINASSIPTAVFADTIAQQRQQHLIIIININKNKRDTEREREKEREGERATK